MKRKFGFWVAILLLGGLATPASAADDAAPVVSEFAMTPSTVDSSSNTRDVSFAFRVTDATGLDNVTINFCSYFGTAFASDSGVNTSSFAFYAPGPRALQRTITATGNRNDLRISIRITLLADALPQTCEVTTYASDTRANSSGNVDTGETLTITRSRAADDAAPVVSEFAMTPSTVDSSSNTRDVSFAFRVTDATGLDNVTINFCSYFGTAFASDSGVNTSSFAFYAPGPRALQRTITATGNRNDLRISIRITLLADALPQTCEVTTYASDTRANSSGNVDTGKTLVISRSGRTPSPSASPSVSISPSPSPTVSLSPSPSPSPSPNNGDASQASAQNTSIQKFSWNGSSLSISMRYLNSPTIVRVLVNNRAIGTKRLTSSTSTSNWRNVPVGDISVVSVTNPLDVPIAKQISNNYPSCTKLNVVFVGGVAKSAKTKNKGQRTRQKPSISASLYQKNIRLDRDRDGIVCER